MKKQLICAVALSAILISCASPLPISQLSSDETPGRWVAGRKYITQTQGDQSLTLSYYRNEGNMLIFDALFENQGSQAIEFSPGYAQIIGLNEEKQEISRALAIDPEEKLLEFDKSESRAKAQLSNQITSNALFATTDLIATVVEETDPQISRAETDASYNRREWDRTDRLNDINRQESYLESIRNTRLYWEEAPIRRTTVLSNEYIEGRFFFDRNNDAKFYIISFDIPDAGVFTFQFEQQLIKPFNE
ncbi:hypothetical protein [Roseivirga sp.]|uniref:hypothetical protein n=1 Tax=Roseivirga sp. TaxID=1964215 RepID=UPI003B524E8E